MDAQNEDERPDFEDNEVGKAKRKKRGSHAKELLTSKKKVEVRLLTLAIIAAIVAVAVIIVRPIVKNLLNRKRVLTTTELMKVVDIDELSTAECVYNGIAEKKDDDGNVKYRIAYESRVQIGLNLSEVDFSDIDQENKVVRPVLPEITIGDIEIDTSTLDYMPKDPKDLDMAEVIGLCKEDARSGCMENAEFYALARENAQAIVESLTMPLIESRGYTISWEPAPSEETAEGSAA